MISINYFQKALRENAAMDMVNLASKATNQIDFFMSRLTNYGPKTIVQADVFERNDPGVISTYLKDVVEARGDYLELYVVDKEDIVIASSNSEHIGYSMSVHEPESLDILQMARQGKKGDVFVRDAHIDEETKETEILLMTPVPISGDNNPVLMLVGSARMDFLTGIIADLDRRIIGNKSTSLVNHKGEVIFTMDKEVGPFSMLTDISVSPQLQELLKTNGEGYVNYIDAKKDAVLAGIVHTHSYGANQEGCWAIVAIVPQRDIYTPVTKMRDRIILLGLLAIISSILAVFLVNRRMLKTAKKLIKVSQSIQQGNLSERIKDVSKDEIGMVASIFNQMMDSIEKEINEHKRLEHEIEYKARGLEQANIELVHQREIVLSSMKDLQIAQERLKQTAQELERSNKELEQFAYAASHDMHEPLRMVTSYVQLLEMRYRDKLDKDAKDFIEFAVEGASRMHALIEDLLAYSRITTRGKEFTACNCKDILKDVLHNLEITIEESQAEITLDPLPVVNGDAIQLTRLFQNLIANAIKFRKKEEDPRIRISAGRRGKEWLFSVQDNGIGLEKEYRERIFQIFQRLHTRTEYHGTGIGLAMAKKIVEHHRGRIWVESELGRGSTFYFTIPDSGEFIRQED